MNVQLRNAISRLRSIVNQYLNHPSPLNIRKVGFDHRRIVVRVDDLRELLESVEKAEVKKVELDSAPLMDWKPIETAPKDNKRPLYLARFNDDGVLSELDFNGSWQSESESWELPEVYWYWGSECGIEEPTHWMYQDRLLSTGFIPTLGVSTFDPQVSDKIYEKANEVLYRVSSQIAELESLGKPSDQHPDDAAVDEFAAAMKAKLAAARVKGRAGWNSDEASNLGLSIALRNHVGKGDPIDVANFAMFLHQRGESILPAPAGGPQAVPDAEGDTRNSALGHHANEWADVACNAQQYLTNVREGISTADEAIQDIQSQIDRVRAEGAELRKQAAAAYTYKLAAREIHGSVIRRLYAFQEAYPQHWCGFLDDALGAAEVIADRLTGKGEG